MHRFLSLIQIMPQESVVVPKHLLPIRTTVIPELRQKPPDAHVHGSFCNSGKIHMTAAIGYLPEHARNRFLEMYGRHMARSGPKILQHIPSAGHCCIGDVSGIRVDL